MYEPSPSPSPSPKSASQKPRCPSLSPATTTLRSPNGKKETVRILPGSNLLTFSGASVSEVAGSHDPPVCSTHFLLRCRGARSSMPEIALASCLAKGEVPTNASSIGRGPFFLAGLTTAGEDGGAGRSEASRDCSGGMPRHRRERRMTTAGWCGFAGRWGLALEALEALTMADRSSALRLREAIISSLRRIFSILRRSYSVSAAVAIPGRRRGTQPPNQSRERERERGANASTKSSGKRRENGGNGDAATATKTASEARLARVGAPKSEPESLLSTAPPRLGK